MSVRALRHLRGRYHPFVVVSPISRDLPGRKKAANKSAQPFRTITTKAILSNTAVELRLAEPTPKLLGKPFCRPLRVVAHAITLWRQRTTDEMSFCCLIGFADDPNSASARLELIRTWGVPTNPVRYQPSNARREDDYVHGNQTQRQLTATMRYYSRLNRLGQKTSTEYKGMETQCLRACRFARA